MAKTKPLQHRETSSSPQRFQARNASYKRITNLQHRKTSQMPEDSFFDKIFFLDKNTFLEDQTSSHPLKPGVNLGLALNPAHWSLTSLGIVSNTLIRDPKICFFANTRASSEIPQVYTLRRTLESDHGYSSSHRISLIAGWIERLLVLINFHWSCSAKRSLPKRREHCFSASCKGAEEKRELYIKTCLPSDSLVQLEQRRLKEAEEHTFQLLFISGSGFQLPGPRSQVPDPRSRIQVPGLRLPALLGGEIQWLHEKASSDHFTTPFPGNKP
ncbi:hypothetical protein YC2023_071547 [Brassica napus]